MRNIAFDASPANPLHRSDNLWRRSLSRHSQACRKIVGTDQDGIDSGDRDNLIDLLDRILVLNLQDQGDSCIRSLKIFIEVQSVSLRSCQAHTALAEGSVFGKT